MCRALHAVIPVRQAGAEMTQPRDLRAGKDPRNHFFQLAVTSWAIPIVAARQKSYNLNRDRQHLNSGFWAQSQMLFPRAAWKFSHPHQAHDAFVVPEPLVGSRGTVANEA